MINQVSSVSFLVYTHCFVWSCRALTVVVMVPKLGSIRGNRGSLEGVKSYCLHCKRQFARSGQISKFDIFAPRNAAPCRVPPGAHAPRPPFPPPLVMITNVLPPFYASYKLLVHLCRRSTCVDLLIDQLCDSVRHMRPFMIL